MTPGLRRVNRGSGQLLSGQVADQVNRQMDPLSQSLRLLDKLLFCQCDFYEYPEGAIREHGIARVRSANTNLLLRGYFSRNYKFRENKEIKIYKDSEMKKDYIFILGFLNRPIFSSVVCAKCLRALQRFPRNHRGLSSNML